MVILISQIYHAIWRYCGKLHKKSTETGINKLPLMRADEFRTALRSDTWDRVNQILNPRVTITETSNVYELYLDAAPRWARLKTVKVPHLHKHRVNFMQLLEVIWGHGK